MAAAGGYWKGGSFQAMPKGTSENMLVNVNAKGAFEQEKARYKLGREREDLSRQIDTMRSRLARLDEQIETIRQQIQALGPQWGRTPDQRARADALSVKLSPLQRQRDTLSRDFGAALARRNALSRRWRDMAAADGH